MRPFKDLSITNKLRFIVLAISGLTLVLACGILGAIEVLNFRRSQVHELTMLSAIIADRCTASLAFDDPKVSLETLGTLKAKKSIICAQIFTAGGDLFAHYRRPDVKECPLPDIDRPKPYAFIHNSLLVYAPVLLDAKKIGAVYIRSDLTDMYALIRRYMMYVALVLLGSLLVVFFLISKFQQFISKPILSLARTAEKISMDMNFSEKVPKEGEDEIGLLVDAFNAMVDQIQQRDKALLESKNRAEASAHKARELARETYRVNLTLQNEIAERKRAFESMLESEKKYRGIFENAQEGIFRATPENRFLDVNPSMARILGYTSPEELVRSVSDVRKLFVDPSEQERLYELLNTQESVSRFECRLKRKDNSLIWGSIQAVAYRDKESKLVFVEGLIEDITDRKMAEEALKDAYHQLEKRVEERTAELRQINEELLKAKQAADEASNAKSVFLANMSHEIRTPMNGVISAAELALSEDMSPKVRHYLKIIHSSGNALLGIINDILDFSKIDAGKLVLEKHPFQIDDLLHNVIAIFAHTAADKNIELIVDVDPETPYRVIGDPLRLQQILTNLMSNSVKFTDSNGMIRIMIRPEEKTPDGIVLKFIIQDTGIGMTQQQLEMLFQAFMQGDTSTTRKFGGTGLGLCISKQLVELMNGQIDAKSEFGKGSEFAFTVTLGLQSDHLQKIIALPQHLKGLSVLIVDDCQDAREVLVKVLKSFGCHPETAASGIQAIDILKATRPTPFDFILMDFKMPDMHGLETAVIIRSELKLDVPIGLMIDFVDKSILPESAQIIVNRLLTKPVMASSIFNMILEIFGEKPPAEEKPKPLWMDALNGYQKALGGLHVLVVEDNPINQELAVEIFKTIGVDVVIAEDGVKALEALSAQSFDAVLMDIQMPVMDGYETTRKIRENERFKDLPIIAMTASALPSDEQKCLDAGMNAFVSKPIQIKKLFQTIYEHVAPKNPMQIMTPLEPPDMIWSRPPRAEILKNPGQISTQHLDAVQAMENLNLDKAAYVKLIASFFHQNQDAVARMKSWAQEGDLKSIRSLAHTIAGTSGHIGAFSLQLKAKALDQYCKEAHPPIYDLQPLHVLLEDLDHTLRLTLADIDGLIQKHTSEEINPHGPESCGRSEKHAVLNGLFHALKQANPLAITDSLNKFKQYFQEPWVHPIEAKILDYEYEDAGRMLYQIALDMGVNVTQDASV